MGRITELDLGGDCVGLLPHTACAIRAALPQLQWLDCSLPGEGEWTARLQGAALLRDLAAGSLQHLTISHGHAGPGHGEGLASLTALTHLAFRCARGVGSGTCSHVAQLSGLRHLVLDPHASECDSICSSYSPADVAALSSLVHLTRLRMGSPFAAAHLPLARLPALLELGCCAADVDAFAAQLALPSLARLRELWVELLPGGRLAGGAAAVQGATAGSAAAVAAGAAAAVARGPLLPELEVLGCCLPLHSQQQVARLPQLLRRLPDRLRSITWLSPKPTSRTEAVSAIATLQQVVYPLLAPCLTRFTAVQALRLELWNRHRGRYGHQGPALPCDSSRLQLPPGGTFADVVRAMPRLVTVDLSLGEACSGTDAAQQQQHEGRAWLTDEALEALASQPRSQLRRVALRGAAHVTFAGVTGLLQLPHLRYICISDCQLVPWQQREALKIQARRGSHPVTIDHF